MNAEAFVRECSQLRLAISPETLAQFSEFESDLYLQNKTRNLTRVPQEECWIRHFLDSLLICSLIPESASVLDIGCGPGFPSWPVAAARPDLLVTALDSSGKMLDFLRRHPLPNLAIVQDRAETWGVRNRFDFVIGRAVAPLSVQLEISAAPLRMGGFAVPMRTPTDRSEVNRLANNPLGLRLVDIADAELPVLRAMRLFPVFEKVGRTPETYPRSWAEIRHRPI